MILQAAIDAALPQLRAEAEARMTSRALIRRKTTDTGQDEDTGLEGSTWTPGTLTPFRLGGVERGGNGSRAFNVGGVEVTLAVRVGHFPVGTDLRDGDLIDVTAGENAGTVWRVIEGDGADQQTALRVPVIAADRPQEWD